MKSSERNFRFLIVFLAAVLTLAVLPPVLAHEGESSLELQLRRDLGFGSGVQIQGLFSLIIPDSQDVVRVEFLLDDEVIGEDAEAPFSTRIYTGNYPLGWHVFRAIGYTADGHELESNTLQRQFVSGNVAIFVVVAVILLILAFRAVSYYLTRDNGQQTGDYGLYGPAVCPNCGKPFARHWWAPNLVAGKLDRCPHCHKWNLVSRASPGTVEQAEALLTGPGSESAVAESVAESEEERLRRRLEESRFDE